MAKTILTEGLRNTSEFDLRSFIDICLAKARALAHVSYGESGEGFRRLNDELQDEFMWALAGLIDDATEAQNEINRRHIATFETKAAEAHA